MPTDNYLKSIFSERGYFYLKPRTLQVLFCPCVLSDREKLGYFLKRNAPNRTWPKPEVRASFELAWIWFRTHYEIWGDIINITSRLAGELISQCSDPFCKLRLAIFCICVPSYVCQYTLCFGPYLVHLYKNPYSLTPRFCQFYLANLNVFKLNKSKLTLIKTERKLIKMLIAFIGFPTETYCHEMSPFW